MSDCPYANVLDPEFYSSGMPYEELAGLRNAGPVLRVEDPKMGVPFWLVTRQTELDFVSKNPQLFSSQRRGAIPFEMSQDDVDTVLSRMILHMDPPRQQKFRRIIRDAFMPNTVASYESEFRNHAKDIINAVASHGKCEFVRDVAAELPLIAILGMFDVPKSDRAKFFYWTNQIFFTDDPDIVESEEATQNAVLSILGYAYSHIETYKTSPKNNVIGALLSGVVDGAPVSNEEFCWIFLMSIVAGNESTRTAIAHGMRLLMEHPDQYEYLVKHPEAIKNAVEEVLRYNTAFTVMRRTAVQDIELGGQKILAGDKVILHYPSVNHDEAVFGQDSLVFDIRRAERHPSLATDHRAFGVGQHFCIGAHLARLEMRIMIEEILLKIRAPRFAAPVRYIKSNFVNGIKEMRIEFDVV